MWRELRQCDCAQSHKSAAQWEVHEPNLHADPEAILLHRFLSLSIHRSPAAAASVLPASCCCDCAKLRQYSTSLVACKQVDSPRCECCTCTHRQLTCKARVESRRRTPALPYWCSPTGAVIICGPLHAAAPCPSKEPLGIATPRCDPVCNGRIDCVTAEAAASCDPARTTYTISTRTCPATWISSGLPTPKRRTPTARRGMLHMGRPPRSRPLETPARLRN